MKLEGHIYCDGPDCDVNWHAGLTRFRNRTLVSLPPGWLVVVEHGDLTPEETSFCGHDCLMKWAAEYDPPERIEL